MWDLLVEGSEIAVLGMGVVFVILILIVFAVRGMSAIALRLEPAPFEPRGGAAPAPQNDADVVAAVTAAIDAYRRRRAH